MNILERYRRLTLWNKVAFWGSVTSFVGLALWFWPQSPRHEPVVEARMEPGKVIAISNVGTVDVDDLVIFGTIYRLKSIVDEKNHLLISGIDSFSKISTPVFRVTRLPANGGDARFDLRTNPSLFPLAVGIADPRDPLATTVYCLRIEYRDAYSKKKHSLTVQTGALLDMPDLIGDHSRSAIGGGFDTARKLAELSRTIRDHQQSLFR